MTDLFRDLYETLLNGIKENEKNNSDRKRQIETCFHLSESIRRRVDKMISTAPFKSEEEEILFFKTVKPAFTSMVEFYSILYRAELFIPFTKPDQMEFWAYELQRAQLFLARHEDILKYIKSGDSSRDREYFLPDVSGGISASQDELIAKLLAREKYIEYINVKLLPGIEPVNPSP